jgi:hypothetical protein
MFCKNMLKIFRAASVAAIIVTLAAGAMGTDAGFALGFTDDGRAITADTITVDQAALDADQATLDQARIADTKPVVSQNGKIVFISGTGGIPNYIPPADAPVSAVSNETSISSDETAVHASSLSQLVARQNSNALLNAEEHCLAGAVYFESKGESLPGQLAVARVVMARAKSGRFPSSYCGVVFQKSQFSFIRGGRMPTIDKGGKNWRNAVAITKIALSDSWKSPVEGALFFHARYVSPGWRLSRIGAIDNHIFYR